MPEAPAPEPSTPSIPTSTEPTDPTTDCLTDEDFFLGQVEPLVQSECIACHTEGGLADSTRLGLQSDDPEANRAALEPLALEWASGLPLLLAKPSGATSHGGGVRFGPDDSAFAILDEFVARAHQPGGCEHPGPWPEECPPGALDPGTTPLLRLTAAWHTNAIRDLLGVSPPTDQIPASEPGDGFRHWVDANPISDAAVESFLDAAEAVAADVAADPRALLGCDAPWDCANDWIHDFAARAFRRPLSPGEVDLVDALYATGHDPVDGTLRVIEGVLQMPQFLYLRLLPEEDGSDVVPLDDYAVASRLSFLLLGTTPDAALLDRAARGELSTRAEVRATARTMLADRRWRAGVEAFHEDWLQTALLESAYRDPERYPEFDAALVTSMRTELRHFASRVAWIDSGSFDTLIHSRTTWTDPALDALYGTSDARVGTGWELRELPADRTGVLGRAAFLASHSDATDASPVRRGAAILERLLCIESTPPADVDTTLPPGSGGTSVRERLAAHRADPSCAGCHDRIDPLGFGLDHYGALGEWRDHTPDGAPVNASGSLILPPGNFDGLAEMVAVLDQGRDLRDCYAQQWLVYALGRPHEEADHCAVSTAAARFDHTGGDLQALVLDVVSSDTFLHRRSP